MKRSETKTVIGEANSEMHIQKSPNPEEIERDESRTEKEKAIVIKLGTF